MAAAPSPRNKPAFAWLASSACSRGLEEFVGIGLDGRRSHAAALHSGGGAAREGDGRINRAEVKPSSNLRGSESGAAVIQAAASWMIQHVAKSAGAASSRGCSVGARRGQHADGTARSRAS